MKGRRAQRGLERLAKKLEFNTSMDEGGNQLVNISSDRVMREIQEKAEQNAAKAVAQRKWIEEVVGNHERNDLLVLPELDNSTLDQKGNPMSFRLPRLYPKRLPNHPKMIPKPLIQKPEGNVMVELGLSRIDCYYFSLWACYIFCLY